MFFCCNVIYSYLHLYSKLISTQHDAAKNLVSCRAVKREILSDRNFLWCFLRRAEASAADTCRGKQRENKMFERLCFNRKMTFEKFISISSAIVVVYRSAFSFLHLLNERRGNSAERET